MLNPENLEKRREQLVVLLKSSEESQKILKEQLKDLKMEISNINGAILELEHLLRSA